MKEQQVINPLSGDRVLLSQADIQAIFNIGKSTVEQWRLRGTGPRFIRIPGSRLVRYRRQDVLDFINSQQAVSSTTEADAV